MIPKHYNNLPDRFKLMFEWGNPFEHGKRYSYRDWDDYLHHGFTSEDVPTLLALLADNNLIHAGHNTNAAWVPLYSWRILGQLQSSGAIDALVQATYTYLELDDEFASSETPVALGMIGRPAMAAARQMLFDETSEDRKIAAATALTEMVRNHPELREEVLAMFQQVLQSPQHDYDGFYGLLTCNLIDIGGVELIDDIRSLYGEGRADIVISGDLEDVEIALGVRQERSTPKPHYALDKYARSGQLPQYTQPIAADPFVREEPKVGRNEPCPCGSGKKYKRCCL